MALGSRHIGEAEKTVYHFFVATGGVQPYSKVKSVLQYLQEYKFKVNITYAFYNLIRWGVIIPTINNSYRLSEPMVISNAKTGRSIGINLGVELKSSMLSIDFDFQDIGLLVFHDSYELQELGIVTQHLNLLKRLKQIRPIGKIVKANCTKSFLPQFNGRISLYEPKNNSWKEATVSKLNELNECLVKSYSSYNDYYFEYVFKYNEAYYRFRLTDVETINLIKTYLILQVSTSTSFYGIDNGAFKLSNMAPFPTTIERILAAHHMLITGCVAVDRSYQLDVGSMRRLEKILSI